MQLPYTGKINVQLKRCSVSGPSSTIYLTFNGVLSRAPDVKGYTVSVRSPIEKSGPIAWRELPGYVHLDAGGRSFAGDLVHLEGDDLRLFEIKFGERPEPSFDEGPPTFFIGR